MPAWLLSTVLHASLLVALGFLAPNRSAAIRPEPERRAGIALVHRDVSPIAQPTSALEMGDDLLESLPSTRSSGSSISLPALPGLSELGSGQVAVTRADGFDTTRQRPRVGGGQGQTTLFGVQATGSTFVYVFDRSSSMSSFQQRPIVAAKAELIGSLANLESVQQFQIIFYNENPTPFIPFAGQPPRMLFASEENKSLASRFVMRIAPLGATQHLAALEMALRMQADAIYFLTDAAEPQLTASQLQQIRRRNRGAAIHAIEFGIGPDPGGENFLHKLARQNSGRHVYVDVTALPATTR